MKKWIAVYFNFTRKDRIGILVIVLLIVLTFLLPEFFPGAPELSQTDTTWITAIKKLEVQMIIQDSSRRKDDSIYYPGSDRQQPVTAGRLFDFDPNTLIASGWKELGLRDKTINTIRHYLEKGGHFKKPEDLQHVYGLSQNEYQRLLPFVKIKQRSNEEKRVHLSAGQFNPNRFSSHKVFDINTSDTTAWIALPGIGSKLAARIVNFREKLGGFYSINQVAETYGLPDSVFEKIRQYLQLNGPLVRKLNINTATIDELKNHPYIRYGIATAIIAYRKEHGPFAKIEDIKKIMMITEEIYNKIVPYISIQ